MKKVYRKIWTNGVTWVAEPVGKEFNMLIVRSAFALGRLGSNHSYWAFEGKPHGNFLANSGVGLHQCVILGVQTQPWGAKYGSQVANPCSSSIYLRFSSLLR